MRVKMAQCKFKSEDACADNYVAAAGARTTLASVARSRQVNIIDCGSTA